MAAPRIGLALGSGSARGWAHIGVLRELKERGLAPDIVAGASVGALVGAAYASDQLDALETWVRDLGPVDVVRLFDATLDRGGMMSGDRLMRRIREILVDHEIEELAVPFAAVATRLETGQEVWLRSGSMLHAVRASSGLPGLFTPVWHEGHWLIDGGVVNSVPVSVCRALGADYVVGVNLNRHLRTWPKVGRRRAPPPLEEGNSSWSGRLASLLPSLTSGRGPEPGVFEVVGASISIMQDRIMRSRMVGDPPDVVLDVELGDLDLWDFHRAEEAIAAGVQAAAAASGELERLKAAARPAIDEG